jgi:hypothetical protein
VALESTIISHGMPYPQNLETAKQVEGVVRAHGAVPATIAVLGGVPHVGLTPSQLERLAGAGTSVRKVSRRDLPLVCALGLDGATTVSATMLLAARAGIAVFVTGGEAQCDAFGGPQSHTLLLCVWAERCHAALLSAPPVGIRVISGADAYSCAAGWPLTGMRLTSRNQISALFLLQASAACTAAARQAWIFQPT